MQCKKFKNFWYPFSQNFLDRSSHKPHICLQIKNDEDEEKEEEGN